MENPSSPSTAGAVSDSERLAALRRTGLLDTPPEEAFDRLTRLAVRLIGVPVAFVSLVDGFRDFYKSHCGFGEPMSTVRQLEGTTFCHFAIAADGPLVIPDTRAHPVFRMVPTVESLGVAAYAGIPIRTIEGHALGSFCAIDFKPREWTEAEIEILTELARSAEREIQLREALKKAAIQVAETAAVGAESEAGRQQVTRILESITDAFFTVDREWHVTYMNQEAEKLLHRRTDELLGKQLWEEFPEAVGSKFHREYHRAVEEGETVQFEEYFPPLESWFEVRAYPSEDGLSVYFRDVNERKRTEEILRESERRLEEQSYLTRTITDNATVAMFMMNVKGHATFMNPAAEEMTGYTLDEIRDMPLHEAVHHTHPDGTPYPMSECPIDRALPENNDMRAHEDVFVRKDGTFFPVTVAARPIVRDGVPTGTVVEVRDVTEEKRAEEALRREEQRYRSLVQATSSIVWNTSASGELLPGQEAWSAFTGQTEEEYIGWGWLSAIHPDDRAHTAPEWERALGSRTMYEVEYRLRRHDGEYRYMIARGVPILNDDGEIREWVGVNADVTDAKEAEAERERLIRALDLERARLAEFFQAAPAIIAATRGPDHVFELANPPYLELIGDRDLIGRRVADAIPEVVEQGFVGLLDAVYSSGEPFVGNEVPVSLQRTPGAPPEQHFVNFVYQPVRDPDGAVGGIFVHGVDVTDQVQARQQVEEHAAERNAILGQIADGVIVADAEGRITFVNEATNRIHGVAQLDVTPEDYSSTYQLFTVEGDPYPPEELPLTRAVRRGETVRDALWKIRRPDGTEVTAQGSATPVLVDGERRMGAVLTLRDVTQQQQFQQLLERERARLQQVFVHAPAVIAMYSGPDQVIRMVNPVWEQVVGKTDVLGRPFREVFPEFEESGLFELLDRVYETGEPYVGNETSVPLDRGTGVLEETFWNFLWQPLAGADGGVREIFVHAVEVTNQVRARQAVERSAEELARVARALETTNRELDQFAYVASHDLKAPLRGIANLSQWIEEDFGTDVSDEAREHLAMLRGRVHRMEGLIDGILEYSRAGRVREKPEAVDVDALIHEILDLQAPPENITFEIASDLPTLVTERLPLQQVLMNLIGNAVKYTRRHDVRIEIGKQDSGRFWEFYVRDNGPGIAPEYHDRIFGIFQTLEARDKVEGTGIGLSLVKKIVESRGGRVWLESEEGQGTTFHFTWPKNGDGGS